MIDLSSVAGRKKLSGIHRFLAAGYDWDLELVRRTEDCSAQRLKAAAETTDGFLAAIPESDDLHRLHADLGIPTAFIDYTDERLLRSFPRCVFVMDDSTDICHTAARGLLSSGVYASYCYAEDPAGTRWSRERGEIFAKELAKRRIETVRIPPEEMSDRNILQDRIRALEKPAAILAAYDDAAKRIAETCKRLGLRIPDEVALMGIGNDEDICLHAKPSLTSVMPDFEEEGYRAARELHAMMTATRNPSKRVFVCGGTSIADRESTRRTRSVSVLVHDALSFIGKNAFKGIAARDVARHLGVSRRLADLRFRQGTGTSLQQTIIDRRLQEVRRLLAASALPISEIAVQCGYRDANYLKNLFKKRVGRSMREYRRNPSDVTAAKKTPEATRGA